MHTCPCRSSRVPPQPHHTHPYAAHIAPHSLSHKHHCSWKGERSIMDGCTASHTPPRPPCPPSSLFCVNESSSFNCLASNSSFNANSSFSHQPMCQFLPPECQPSPKWINPASAAKPTVFSRMIGDFRLNDIHLSIYPFIHLSIYRFIVFINLTVHVAVHAGPGEVQRPQLAV